MCRVCRVLLLLSLVTPAHAQPAVKELRAFVVAVEATTLTVSNVALSAGHGGETFVMPAPKEGDPPPTWVADGAGNPAGVEGRQPRMVMMMPKSDDTTPLTLTEFQIAKDSLDRADFPTGTSVVVKYREVGASKVVESVERQHTKG